MKPVTETDLLVRISEVHSALQVILELFEDDGKINPLGYLNMANAALGELRAYLKLLGSSLTPENILALVWEERARPPHVELWLDSLRTHDMDAKTITNAGDLLDAADEALAARLSSLTNP